MADDASVTASPYDCAPVVLIVAVPIVVGPAASVVTLSRAVLPPTAPPNSVVPASLTVSE